MDKLRNKNLKQYLRVLFTLSVLTAFAGCSIFQPGEGGKQPPTPTSLIPITGDETPEPTAEIPIPSDEIITAEEISAVDLTAFTNTLWVDVKSGNDANTGKTAQSAFRTVQKAASLAVPGTIIRILPGIYREAVIPAASGTASQPILFFAEKGPGTVIIRGSTASSSLTWTQLKSNSIGLPAGTNPLNVYYADLSSWGLSAPPRYLALLDAGGSVTSRLNPAREPDWNVVTEWKYNEFWWMANGGSAVAGCDPATNSDEDCDRSWRSYTQLTDTTSDTAPAGIEAGNLKTLPNLTGATLVSMDARHAHYAYRRTIVQHDTAAGRITVDSECNNDGTPGLGWGSKYYVENHPALLDHPGEWWYDRATGRLYLWPPVSGTPAGQKIEISRLDMGIDLSNRSYIQLDGIQIDLFNQNAVQIENEGRYDMSHGIQIRSSRLLYANRGVFLHTYTQESDAQYAIDDFLLDKSEIGFMDTTGFESTYWWEGAPSASSFTHSGIRNLTIRNNILHHLGFASDDRSGVGVRIFFPDKIRFEGNHIHHVAQNGVHFHQSLINSSKTYGFSPTEIKIGSVLIKDNLFEDACLAASDCGGLKIGGSKRPDTHVFKDMLIVGNIFRNNFGWSYVSVLRGLNDLGDGNGFYLDYAAGVHLYRNIAFNNSGSGYKMACLWRDGDTELYNNIAANNYQYGFKFTGLQGCDDHNGSVNTKLINNIIMNNGMYGYQFNSAYENTYGNLVIDHNLYFQNGWNNPNGITTAYVQLYRASLPVEHYDSLLEIRLKSPWEDHGMEGNPHLTNYDYADNSTYTYTWPDFSPTDKSDRLLDKGTLLSGGTFSLAAGNQIDDVVCGKTFDIGRFEYTGSLFSGSTCTGMMSVFLPIIRR